MAKIKDHILESIDQLISNPQVIIDSLRFIDQKVLANPPVFYNLNQLIEIINHDPVLVFKIIGRTNSRFFNSINENMDLKAAINTLGPLEVRNLFYEQLGADYIEYLREKSRCLGVGQNLFSNQVAGCAKMAEKTVKYLINSNSAYTSSLIPFKYVIYYLSLLQDIGMIIFDQYDHSLYQSLLQKSQGNVSLLCELEIAYFQGMDHMELGAEALKKWRFAGIYVEIARHHHQLHSPGSGTYQMVRNIITYANNIFYYRNREAGSGKTPPYLTIIPESETVQGLQKYCPHPIDESLFEVIDNFKYENPIFPQ
ncbi:MAG: HDOD domain-containing protein [Firmicutes bacterium]|nr:HDOD domain-containing protein [Bacillota bacterium]